MGCGLSAICDEFANLAAVADNFLLPSRSGSADCSADCIRAMWIFLAVMGVGSVGAEVLNAVGGPPTQHVLQDVTGRGFGFEAAGALPCQMLAIWLQLASVWQFLLHAGMLLP